MTSIENLLARLYTDAELRRRFLARPVEVAIEEGLDPASAATMADIDRDGLELAARSFERKRSGRSSA